MKGFEQVPLGLFTARMEPEEAVILSELASQVVELLLTGAGSKDHYARRHSDDPALLRLLPDAYPDDAEASAEFHRFTVDGLVERKVANAMAVVASLTEAAEAMEPTEVRLDAASVQSWLRCLTDIRLVLADRLEIKDEEQGAAQSAGSPDAAVEPSSETDAMMRDVYDWLALVQESLLHSLDAPTGRSEAVPS